MFCERHMIARCAMIGKRDAQASLPDRLDQNEQSIATRLDAVRVTNKALKPLYAALSDGQQVSCSEVQWA
jgi:hypothetical protein